MGRLRISFTPYASATGEAAIPVDVFNSNFERVARESMLLDSQRPREIDVGPGRFQVQAFLPSGERVVRQVVVQKEETVDVPLTPRRQSPSESLAWSYYLKSPQRGVTMALHESLAPLKLTLATWQLGRPWRWQRREGAPTLDSGPKGATEKFDQGEPLSLGSTEIENRDEQLFLEVQWRQDRTKFVALPPESVARVNFFQEENSKTDPDPINVVVDAATPKAESVLGFLARGDFEHARTVAEAIWDDAEQLLSEKRHNVASAAIGGYFLLQAGSLDRLHDWTKNLDEWFPFFSDGAVIHAWHCLRRQPPDFDLARERLCEAAVRGLPSYSQGLRLLHDGLAMLANRSQDQGRDDIEVSRALDKIKPYVMAADWLAPTTTFFGKSPEEPRPLA